MTLFPPPPLPTDDDSLLTDSSTGNIPSACQNSEVLDYTIQVSEKLTYAQTFHFNCLELNKLSLCCAK